MPSLQETAQFLGVPMDALRDEFRRDPALRLRRGQSGRGARRVPVDTVRRLLANRGQAFTRRVVTIGIEKGGVGKSFLTTHVAAWLAARGCRCLLVDLDPQACATNLLLPGDADYDALLTVLEVYAAPHLRFADAVTRTTVEGLDLVACKGKARRLHRELAQADPTSLLRDRMAGLDAYDLILFDVPPTFGDLITSAYLTSDLVILPTLPDIWSLESIDLTLADIRDACDEFGASAPDCRVILNRQAPARSATRDAESELAENYADLLLPFPIRESAAVQNAINEGGSVFDASVARAPAEVKDALARLAQFVCPLRSTAAAPAGRE